MIGLLLTVGTIGTLGACGADQGARVVESRAVSDTDSGSTTDSEASDAVDAPSAGVTSPADGDALSAKEVLASVGPSVAFIRTELASGTALAIADGYLVTNAHIIVPFGVVEVTPPGGRTFRDVPVVGVDFEADLALIGPLPEPMPAIPVVDDPLVESGDEVFLIGYPSETERSPEPTISEGIVSRLREVPSFDQRFIQTDADIAGGQSGGALVNARGQVIGVSGLSLDEAFALALDFDDVQARLEGMRSGGQPWTPMPNDGVGSASVTVPMHLSNARLELMWTDTDEEISIRLAGAAIGDVGVEVFIDDGTYLASRNMVPVAAQWSGVSPEEHLDKIGAESVFDTAPDGSFRFELPAYQRASVILTRTSPGDPLPLQVTSTRGLRAVDDLDEGTVIAVGDEVRGILEPLEWQDRYTVDLRAGQKVRIRLESAASDVAFYVVAPGETFGPDTFFADDSNIGIGGLDAEGVFTAEVDGPHDIVLWDHFGQSGYLLTVEAA